MTKSKSFTHNVNKKGTLSLLHDVDERTTKFRHKGILASYTCELEKEDIENLISKLKLTLSATNRTKSN